MSSGNRSSLRPGLLTTHFFLFVAWLAYIASIGGAMAADSGGAYEVYVTNERSGDITVIDSATAKVIATFPVGKRPRGIQVSPDRKTIFVAVSGTPISPPPQLDAQGNPIFKKGKDDDDDDDKKSDKSA